MEPFAHECFSTYYIYIHIYTYTYPKTSPWKHPSRRAAEFLVFAHALLIARSSRRRRDGRTDDTIHDDIYYIFDNMNERAEVVA